MYKNSKYELLNNKDLLYKLYIEEGKSTREISKLAGAKTCNSARQALIKFDIPVRNYRSGQTLDIEPNIIYNNSFIDGSLLGDASLVIYNKKSSFCGSYYCRKQKYKEYIKWCSDNIFPVDDFKLEKNKLLYKGKEKEYEFYSFRTPSSLRLREFFNRWYKESNNFIKAVPKDLEFTKEMLLVWFLDDGSSTYRNRNKEKEWKEKNWTQKKEQIIINFASESFSKEDNDYLCEGFNRIFNLDMKIFSYCRGSGWRIKIPQRNTNLFFEILGECPVECYKYKWKIV